MKTSAKEDSKAVIPRGEAEVELPLGSILEEVRWRALDLLLSVHGLELYVENMDTDQPTIAILPRTLN